MEKWVPGVLEEIGEVEIREAVGGAERTERQPDSGTGWGRGVAVAVRKGGPWQGPGACGAAGIGTGGLHPMRTLARPGVENEGLTGHGLTGCRIEG